MSIEAKDLRLYQSQDMTDESSGGGPMSGVEIVAGEDNQIFDDISDVDRAGGDVSIRKIFGTVQSDDTGKFLDAGAVIFRPPDDGSTDVTIFSTGDHFDRRPALQAVIESTVVRGGQITGSWLWGSHIAGQRSLTLWQRMSAEIPGVSDRIDLVAFDSGGNQTHNEVVWITGISVVEVERADSKGLYSVRQVTAAIAEGLAANYDGSEPIRTDPIGLATLLYEMRYNPGAVPLMGLSPLSEAASVGAYGVKVESIYAPLIPTAFVETALPDVTPGADSAVLVSSGGAHFTVSDNVIGPNLSFFFGSPVFPGALTISVSGSVITDRAGRLYLNETDIGVIEYSAGVCRWNDSCPNFIGAPKTVDFVPAAIPVRIADTSAQSVTLGNQGNVWIQTLSPIPQPGSLRVAYRAQNAWYVLIEQGDGTLKGLEGGYGSGSLNFSTGTVTVTTGALPDPDSEILYSWGVPINYFSRGGGQGSSPVVRGQTAHPDVRVGTVTISWPGHSLSDSTRTNGIFSGASGKGAVNYKTGEWWLQPAEVPAMGTSFTTDYSYGAPADKTEEVFDAPALNAAGKLELVLAVEPVPGSVDVLIPVEVDSYESAIGVDSATLPPSAPPEPADPSDPPGPPPTPPEAPPFPPIEPGEPPPPPDPPPPDIEEFWTVKVDAKFPYDTTLRGRIEMLVSAEYSTQAAAVVVAQAIYGATAVSGVVTVVGGTVTVAGHSCTVSLIYSPLSSWDSPPTGAGPHTAFDVSAITLHQTREIPA